MVHMNLCLNASPFKDVTCTCRQIPGSLKSLNKYPSRDIHDYAIFTRCSELQKGTAQSRYDIHCDAVRVTAVKSLVFSAL